MVRIPNVDMSETKNYATILSYVKTDCFFTITHLKMYTAFFSWKGLLYLYTRKTPKLHCFAYVYNNLELTLNYFCPVTTIFFFYIDTHRPQVLIFLLGVLITDIKTYMFFFVNKYKEIAWTPKQTFEDYTFDPRIEPDISYNCNRVHYYCAKIGSQRGGNYHDNLYFSKKTYK